MTTNERELNRHKAKIARWLKEKREETGFTSSFMASAEMRTSRNTIYKIEQAVVIPTKRTVDDLIVLYKLTPKEIIELKHMCETARELRSKVVEENKTSKRYERG